MAFLEAVAGSIVGAVVKSVSPKIISSISKAAMQTSTKMLAKLESTFAPHVEATFQKCNFVQTIFTNEKKIPLKEIYTNLYISRHNKIRDDDIITKINKIGNIVLSGTGGAGKTMLMKYLALSVIENPIGKIPLYIELRNLPAHIPANFNRTIFDNCCIEADDQGYRIFQEGLRNGLFIIFFDGLDEVTSESREQVFNSIKRMAREFKKCNVIASTRPEIDTRNWGELETYKLVGLTLNQAKNLIQKTDFPQELKTEFLALMTQEFFQKYESFFSVPLLCSLMLFTYHEFQSVPSRITVFYEQAFETLMRRHDRAKEGYFKRDFDCGLSSDRFRSIFSAFCYRTLAKQEVSFTDEKFRYHLSRAAEVTEIEVDIDKYASDLVSSVCVIMRDGLNLHFIHRSFQEYFAAIFLLRYKGADAFELYVSLFEALNINDVSSMAADIDIQAFEREWAFPACDKIKSELDTFEAKDRPLKLLSLTWHALQLSAYDPTFFTYSWLPGRFYHEALTQLFKVYGKEYVEINPYCRGETPDGTDAKTYIAKMFPDKSSAEIFLYDEDDEDIEDPEFVLDEDKLDWIRNTSMFQDFTYKVNEIYRLHSDLKSRLDKRRNIDILN
jgi:NACHT domain